MKHIINMTVILSSMLAVSCVSLDRAPHDAIAQGNYWKTEEDAKTAITAVYAQMRTHGAFGYMPLMDQYTDVAHGPGSALEQGKYTAKEDFLVQNWQNTWEGVQRANKVLKNVALMDISSEVKTKVLGEAHFMRALYYFHLVDLFGSVPLYDETWDVGDSFMDMLLPRNTAEECWDFIINDCSAAIEALPVKWPDSDYGRATKGAAYALRGKAFLYTKDWKSAISDFEEIVYNRSESYGYALYDDYYKLFQEVSHVASNHEEVFAMQNKGDVGALYGMEFPMIYGSRGSYGNGRNTCMPSVDLVDDYEWKDGKQFSWDEVIPGFSSDNAIKRAAFESKLNEKLNAFASVPDTALLGHIYRDRDPRLCQSVIVPYSWYEGYVGESSKMQIYAIAPGVTAANGFIQGRGWNTYMYRKFVPCGDMNGALTDRRHLPVNFSIIRFADVLLMLSEAYNENGELDKAVTELNKVRARPSTSMPGLNSGPEWLAVSSKEEMRTRIIRERAFELHGEGHRFSDLRRWGIAEAVLNNRSEVEFTGTVLFTRVFESKHNLWPIPSEETLNNPALLPNNPGW